MNITIITTSLNSAATIRDTMESVSCQTHKNLEHILIDGGSTDETLNIVKEFSHLSKVISEPDDGIYHAMNKGISLATGDFIFFLNSDDVYADRDVVHDYAQLIGNSGCKCVYADLVYVDSAGTTVKRHWKSNTYKHGDFLKGWMPPHPTFGISRETIQQYGDFNTDLNTAADYEFMLRMIHIHKIEISYLKRVTVKMRVGGASNLSLRARIQANLDDRKAWRINNEKPGLFTLTMKPLRKLTQFLTNQKIS